RHDARLAQGVAGLGRSQRLDLVDPDEGAPTLALGILDAGERGLGELAESGAAGGQLRGELADPRVGHLPPSLARSFTRSSSAAGAARVEVSPRLLKSFSAILRRMRRMILPERVLGRPGAHWMTSGVAIGPISLRTQATSSLRRSSED